MRKGLTQRMRLELMETRFVPFCRITLQGQKSSTLGSLEITPKISFVFYVKLNQTVFGNWTGESVKQAYCTIFYQVVISFGPVDSAQQASYEGFY
ncbi:hypothetical protein QQP08_026475 [Theobroma cacao]|nr:hypothetical protein QQP08_026475 [Theobroma cacao]